MEFSVCHPSPPNTYSYVQEENLGSTKKSVEIYILFTCVRLCFCAWRDGFSSDCFSLSYRSFCCHIMLPIRPVKLQNQDKLLRFTSRDILLSTVSYVELCQIKNQGLYLCLCRPIAFTKLLPPQLPCCRCCCCVAPTLALDVVVVATPLVNCHVAPTLAIVNLGCRCLDLMFRPFGWQPWYDSGCHGPWAMVLVFSVFTDCSD